MPRPIRLTLQILAGLVLLLAAAVAAFALLFDANQLRDELTRRVQQRTGRSLAIGDIHVSIYPVLGARIRDVKLGNAPSFGDTPMLQAGEAEVGVALLPLLLHRAVEIDRIRIADAKLALIRNEDGRSNWDDLQQGTQAPGAPAATPQTPAAKRDIDIRGIEIHNTALSFDDRAAKRSLQLDGLDATLGNIRNGKPFDIDIGFHTRLPQPAFAGHVSFKGRATLDTDAQRYAVDDAKLALKGDPDTGLLAAGASLAFSAQLDQRAGTAQLREAKLQLNELKAELSLQIDGLANKAPHLRGPLHIDSFSPRALLKTLGMPAPDTADTKVLTKLALDAQLDASATSSATEVLLQQLKLVLDDSQASGDAGVLDLASKRLKFNLAVDHIDIDRYLPPAAAKKPAADKPAAAAAKSDEAPIPFERLEALNVDGRLQVSQLKLHGLSMNDAELKLQASPGAPKAMQLGARLYKGTLAAASTLSPGSSPRIAQTIKLQDIDLGPLLHDLNGSERLSGHGNLTANLTTSGRTPSALTRALDGPLSLNLRDGAIKGANLAQMLRNGGSLFAGKLIEARGPRQTDFSELSFAGNFANGVLHGDTLTAVTEAARIDGHGTLDLVQRLIDYQLQATLSRPGGDTNLPAEMDGLVIPVFVAGSFDEPRVTLDVQTALRQRAADKLRNRLEGGRERLLQRLGGFLAPRQPQPPPPSP